MPLPSSSTEFGPNEEEAIISLALDYPDLISGAIDYLEPKHFDRIEIQYVWAWVKKLYNEFNIIPSRSLLYDRISQKLTVDDPYEDILKIVKRQSNPRETPMIKESLKLWAQTKQFGLLYSDDAIKAYHDKNFAALQKIVDDAAKISTTAYRGFWLFEDYKKLFEEKTILKYSTGFHRLNNYLNDGGPSPGEVLCWAAPPNVGKCHTKSTLIIEECLSRIYELEFDDGTTCKIAGFRKVQTARGEVRVCDLTEGDDITQIPIVSDDWDIRL